MIMEKEEIVLINKIKEGDIDSFYKIYDKYKRVILNYLYRMVQNREIAEDITQETFLKVYLNIDKYRPIGSFSSWIYCIARNLAKNVLRKDKRQKNISMETIISDETNLKLRDILKTKKLDTETILQNREIQEQINYILSIMPTKYREIIILCIFQMQSYDQASEILNCTKSTVAIRLFRARQFFIKKAKDLWGDNIL